VRYWLRRLRAPLLISALTVVLSQALFIAISVGRSRQDYGCLAFTSYRDRYLLDIASGVALPMRITPARAERSAFARSRAWALYLPNAQQLILERVADAQTFALALDGVLQHAFWSPDERWLVYTERLAISSRSG
jgi:hypothetical protein